MAAVRKPHRTSLADGRSSRTSTAVDGLRYDSSVLDHFVPEEMATEVMEVMSEEEAASLSYELLTVRQRMISADVDALAAPFKQFLKDVQQLIMEKELPDELVTSTRKRLDLVTDSLLYWTDSLLGLYRQSMPKDANAKFIAEGVRELQGRFSV